MDINKSQYSLLSNSTLIKDVDYESQYYKMFERELRKVNDLYEGNQAIKRRGSHYLFKMSNELDDKYEERLRTATLYNCFKGAVNNYKNLILRKGIGLQYNNVLKNPENIFNNIDGQGNDLQASINIATKDALIDGMSFIWIDAPQINADLTIKDVMNSSFRPFIKNLKRTDVINTQTTMIGGIEILTRVVIRQEICVQSDSFKENMETIFIILERDKGYICKKQKYTTYEVVSSWENKLGYIPVLAIYSEKKGFMKASVPLSDLADLNLKYYNASSEKDHIKRMSCNPLPIFYGYVPDEDEQDVIIGVNKALILPDKTSCGAEYLEVTGKSLDYLNADLESLEMKLDKLSLAIIFTNTFKTATEASLNEEKNSLFLVELSGSIENAYNLAFQIMNEYMGINLGASITLTKDFVNKKIDSVMVDELLKLKIAGTISTETLWDALVNGEVLEKFDYDIEKNKLETEKDAEVL